MHYQFPKECMRINITQTTIREQHYEPLTTNHEPQTMDCEPDNVCLRIAHRNVQTAWHKPRPTIREPC